MNQHYSQLYKSALKTVESVEVQSAWQERDQDFEEIEEISGLDHPIARIKVRTWSDYISLPSKKVKTSR